MEKEHEKATDLWNLWLLYINSTKPENLMLERLCQLLRHEACSTYISTEVAFASWYILWRDPWIFELCARGKIEPLVSDMTSVLDKLLRLNNPSIAKQIYMSSRNGDVSTFSMADIRSESLFLGIDGLHEYMYRVYGK